MHSATQLIAQRAPPATRTKARWQPYSMLPSSSTLPCRSPMASYINTPTPPVSSPPAPTNSISDSTRMRPLQTSTISQTPKDSSQRDFSKHKFATGLIDQAVNTISEIWRPQDVPQVFLAPTKGASIINLIVTKSNSPPNQQPSSKLFSPPASPSTKPSPFPQSSIPPTSQLSSSPAEPLLPSGESENLLPMKTFVHEVLRRSRTSGNILQAALCYLEAIRSKVPEILQQERMGIRAHYQPDTLIQPATEAELAREAEFTREAELAALEEPFVIAGSDDPLKTVVSKDCDADFDAQDIFEPKSSECSSLDAQPSESSTLSSTSSSLPSPLLCPRRAFLASLILASKFFQDKCYSNRAWAKLSGLPPREIGRCERALGQALEWRLWVGKTSSSASTARTLTRAQSENSIFIPAHNRTASTNVFSMHGASDISKAPETVVQPLRRSVTLPEEMFSRQSCEEYSQASKISRHFNQAPATQANAGHAHMQDRNGDQPDLQLMDSRFSDESDSSPSPDTPPLTYSPSSTDCSSGDRTIQMSTIEDCMFPNANGSQAWLEYPESKCASTFALGEDLVYRSTHGFAVKETIKHSQPLSVAIVDSEPGPFGHYMWPVDGQYVPIGTTTTH